MVTDQENNKDQRKDLKRAEPNDSRTEKLQRDLQGLKEMYIKSSQTLDELERPDENNLPQTLLSLTLLVVSR